MEGGGIRGFWRDRLVFRGKGVGISRGQQSLKEGQYEINRQREGDS